MTPNKKFMEWLSSIATTIAVTLAIMQVIFGKQSTDPGLTKIHITPQGITIISEFINIAILIFFSVIINEKSMDFDSIEKRQKFGQDLNILDEGLKKVDKNIDRVNILTSDIVKYIKFYLAFLIIFYACGVLDDNYIPGPGKVIEPGNWVLVLQDHLKFPLIEFLINSSNLISGSYLFLVFLILYRRTLTSNNQSNNYYLGTLFFTITYIAVYFIILQTRQQAGLGLDEPNIIFKLICGVFNGLAMGLLFGRFTSMEYYFKDNSAKQGWRSSFTFNFGIVYVLPLYVLAQPMFGLLTSPGFKEMLFFKPAVFLVCFIGKTFYLIIVYNYIETRHLHTYMHLLLANYKVPLDISKIFPINETNTSEEEPQTEVSPFLMKIGKQYEYECKFQNNNHSHGGLIEIVPVSIYENSRESNISGTRTWERESRGRRHLLDNPRPWKSEKFVIFKDKTYMYTFQIRLDGENHLGVSTGNVKFHSDGFTIAELKGEFYQHTGEKIYCGDEKIWLKE